jgi:2-methylisocitrate lyase-like PEP mutase family enzyme
LIACAPISPGSTKPERDIYEASCTADVTLVQAPGVFDGLSALLVEQAHFPLAFFSGASFSFTRYGRPDLGLIGMSEVAETVRIIRARVALPLIVDADTGYGNALNVQRTVRELETAGASAIQLEDQVMPKRCGHMHGKQVIPTCEMIGKLHAALDTRRDGATLIIARTDSLAIEGLDAALDRADAYFGTAMETRGGTTGGTTAT